MISEEELARRAAEKRERAKIDRRHRAFYKAILKMIENGNASTDLQRQYIVLTGPDLPEYSENEKNHIKDNLHAYFDFFLDQILDNRHMIFPVDREYRRDHPNDVDLSLILHDE